MNVFKIVWIVNNNERKMLYNLISVSVYQNHGTLDKFFTPVIEYFIKMLKAYQVLNIHVNNTFRRT